MKDRIIPLFGKRLDGLLVSMGFHYSGPSMGKQSSYDLKLGEDYRRRIRIFYNQDIRIVYDAKIMLFCMDTPSVIYIKDEGDITKELLKGFIKVCNNPVVVVKEPVVFPAPKKKSILSRLLCR